MPGNGDHRLEIPNSDGPAKTPRERKPERLNLRRPSMGNGSAPLTAVRVDREIGQSGWNRASIGSRPRRARAIDFNDKLVVRG